MSDEMTDFIAAARTARAQLTGGDWYADADTPEYRALVEDCVRIVSCVEFGELLGSARA